MLIPALAGAILFSAGQSQHIVHQGPWSSMQGAAGRDACPHCRWKSLQLHAPCQLGLVVTDPAAHLSTWTPCGASVLLLPACLGGPSVLSSGLAKICGAH